MNADAKTEAEVLGVLNEWLQSYKERDIDGLMALVAPDDDLFLFGTGLDEKRVGPDEFKYQAQRDWSQTDELSFNFTSYHVSAAGPVAWVASEGLGYGRAGGQAIEFPLRMTTVLEQREGQWLIVQSHVSLPSAAQEEGDSVPV